jgi:tRNA uridine 5-carboxymethylaminomethyl modification enzyme
MGVMVDDLITRGVDEPYRMFTSRAEYRLILREDNAVFRLMDKGHEFGLIPDQDYRGMMERTRQIDQGIGRLSSLTLKPTAEVNGILSGMGSLPIRKPMTLFQLLKRPEMVYDSLRVFEGWSPIADDDVKRQIEIEAKYEDYIRRQRESVEKFMELEHKKIPPDMDYGVVPGLSNELKHKLQKIQPSSIGQARRISGMTQAALAAILIFLKKMELERETG